MFGLYFFVQKVFFADSWLFASSKNVYTSFMEVIKWFFCHFPFQIYVLTWGIKFARINVLGTLSNLYTLSLLMIIILLYFDLIDILGTKEVI